MKKTPSIRRKKGPAVIDLRPKLPPHVRKSANEMIDCLRESCEDDDELLRLCIVEPDHKRVLKVLRSDKEQLVSWSIGYLQGIADTFHIDPEALLQS